MKRFFSSILFAGVITAVAIACDSSDATFSSGSSGGAGSFCPQFGDCETCTIQYGCGWCYRADGTGSCLPDPSECVYSTRNTWTWDMSGCGTTANPTVGPEAEGGTSEGAIDAAPSPSKDAAAANDAETAIGDAGSNSESTPDTGAKALDAGAVDASADADLGDGS